MFRVKDVRLNYVVPLVAVSLLIIGTMATIYVKSYEEKGTAGTINVSGVDVPNSILFSLYDQQILRTSVDETHIGIPLSKVLEYAHIETPTEYRYMIIGSDGYGKEVEWEHIEKSVLTAEKRIVFADLPKQFWVRNIIEIRLI